MKQRKNKVFTPFVNTILLAVVFLIIVVPMYAYSGKFSNDDKNQTEEAGLTEIEEKLNETENISEEVSIVEEEKVENASEQIINETITNEEIVNETVQETETEEQTETANETTEVSSDEITEITVTEGDLLKVTTVSKDPDGDTLTYTFSEPLNDKGEWQTQKGDAGKYTAKITASDGKSETTKEILIVVEPLE